VRKLSLGSLGTFFLSLRHATGYEDLKKNHRQEPKLSFLIKAIYTMAYGLEAYQETVCGKDFVGVCPEMKKSFNHSIFLVRQTFASLRFRSETHHASRYF
jgi:hypothetical protein